MTKITVPEFSLIVLIGASGSGKSTFARTHFLPTEVVSSDFCRGLVADDENDQSASKDAFALLHFIASKRLDRMRLTVVDATNVQAEARKPLIALAREYHALPVAIVLDMPDRVSIARNALRPDRGFGAHVIRRQRGELKRSLRNLQREGFRRVIVLSSEEEVANVNVARERLWTDLRSEHGPFDIIGDIHGCFDELVLLLQQLGYQVDADTFAVVPPDGRKVIFLGDLVDRGPKIPQVLKLVMGMVACGDAHCVPGNHDVKLMRALQGKKVSVTHGLAKSLEQLSQESDAFRGQVIAFLDSLISHYVMDGGKLVVAHAAMKESMAGRASSMVRDFALYGEVSGETDDFGLPVRLNWAAEYRGDAMVVYGHTPVPKPEWLNRTVNIDTGCVFGGALTALRYPEREFVSVPALEMYAESSRPFLTSASEPSVLSAQQQMDDVLDVDDVLGKRLVETRLRGTVTIREENAAAALEVMSRFVVNPRWLVYLPPTMSPVETSALPDLLEHPREAFEYYRANGVQEVICEEKHMGSRAVVVICRDEGAVYRRFGITNEGIGVVYTRTGRRFFHDSTLEQEFLAVLNQAIQHAGLWEELETTWMVLDCELMPWSVKAQELLQSQYATVGAAGSGALHDALAALQMAAARGGEVDALLTRFQSRAEHLEHYTEAYRLYCWDVQSLADLRLAPFHLLASEGVVHSDKPHRWHIQTLSRLVGPLLYPTAHCYVDVQDEESVEQGIAWWLQMTERGGEGMVVKPNDFVAGGRRGLLQPAVKVRGREYLRIIYGPEYAAPDQMERLRSRGLGAKRSLALREFALGVEALERFVRHEPLRRVHECVFGVLALESEPIDPRL